MCNSFVNGHLQVLQQGVITFANISSIMEQAAKRGVILMNLGSPDSTEVKDVARDLK